jgi:threonine dehydrogenase-like Zn-dependent dehydrogenase
VTATLEPAAPAPGAIASRVAWLTAPQRLEWRSEPLGSPGPAQLLCETLVTAISPGTELAAWSGAPPLRDGTGYPRLLGYCNVARVLAAGSAVGHIRPGQRVLSFAAHRSHSLIAADEVLLVLEEGMRSAEIACAYLYQLGYNAVLSSEVRAGSHVLVIGLGALGLTSVAMAAIAGAQVCAVSDQALPRRLGGEFGARAVFTRAEAQAAYRALTPQLADVVITTSNSWEDFGLALKLAGNRATIACLGFPGRSQPPGSFNPLDSRYFYVKQLRIEAVGMSPERPDARGFLRFDERTNLGYIAGLIHGGVLHPAALAPVSYSWDRLEQAYRELLTRRGSAVTCLLQWLPG